MKDYDKLKVDRESEVEERMRVMLDAMPLSCSFWDSNCRIIDCNREAIRLFELADKQKYMERFFELSPERQPDGQLSAELVHRNTARVFASDRREHFEWMHRNLKGELIPTEVTMTRVSYGDGFRVVTYTRDMRELKASLEHAREIEERNRIMLDATPICCNFWDENCKNISCNQEAVNLFELAGKQEYLDRFFELSPGQQPDGRPSSKKMLEKIRETFQSGRTRFEWLHQKLNGEPIPAEVTLVRVARDNGYVVAGYTRDLRELKETVAMLNQLERLAFTDALTGIFNRRRFMDHAEKAFGDFNRTQKPLSIIMMDLDHFKEVNDTWGHVAGDEILKSASREMQGALRSTDLLARYGGEEFIVLLTEADRKVAHRLAERIRSRIADFCFGYDGHEIPLTASLGVATKNSPEATLEDVIELADRALYKAKISGRNRVELA